MNKISLLTILLIFTVATTLVFAQETVSRDQLMRDGLEDFKSGMFNSALNSFREVTLDTNLKDYHGSAYFWITKCYLAQSNLIQAGENLDFFLENFEGHPFVEEGLYQKGRIEFLKSEFENAIGEFYTFINEYDNSAFIPNSYFWIGESLYNLGHYEEAEEIFYFVVKEFPTSYKMEAANYRLALIDLVKREDVLIDLVKLSHEEYVTSLDEFKRKERTYEQAISSYQRRITQLEIQLEEKSTPIITVLPPVETVPEKVEPVVETPPPVTLINEPALENRQKLLEMKNTVLEIKAFLIELLSEQFQGGM